MSNDEKLWSVRRLWECMLCSAVHESGRFEEATGLFDPGQL